MLWHFGRWWMLWLGILMVGAGSARAAEATTPLQVYGFGEFIRFALTPDGSQAVACGGSNAYLFDLKTGQRRVLYAGHGLQILYLTLTPDGGKLLTGSSDGTAKLWDVATGKVLRTFTGHT